MIRQLRLEFKFPAKIEMAFPQILAIRWWFKIPPLVSKSKSKWYKHQKTKKSALNSWLIDWSNFDKPCSDDQFGSFLILLLLPQKSMVWNKLPFQRIRPHCVIFSEEEMRDIRDLFLDWFSFFSLSNKAYLSRLKTCR